MQRHTPDLPPAGSNASACPAPGPAGDDFETLLSGSSLGAPRARAIRGLTPQALHERLLHLERLARYGCPVVPVSPPDPTEEAPLRPFALTLFTPAPAGPVPCDAGSRYDPDLQVSVTADGTPAVTVQGRPKIMSSMAAGRELEACDVV